MYMVDVDVDADVKEEDKGEGKVEVVDNFKCLGLACRATPGLMTT